MLDNKHLACRNIYELMKRLAEILNYEIILYLGSCWYVLNYPCTFWNILVVVYPDDKI